MPQNASTRAEGSTESGTSHTWQEICAQPELWPLTAKHVAKEATQLGLARRFAEARVVLTGAGTSAYAAEAIASAWPGAVAVPSTDLLVDAPRLLAGADVLISLARSGNSPESAAVVELARSLRPDLFQLGIVCNAGSALARSPMDHVLLLDPRTDDKSLVMTSSFSNLVVAGLALACPETLNDAIGALSRQAQLQFDTIQQACRSAAEHAITRIVVLASSPLDGWRHEAALKLTEMSAGRFPVLAESYLGLRHGPMVFTKSDTLVLCLLSNDTMRRAYELDLLRELRNKEIGFLAGITTPGSLSSDFDLEIPAVAPTLADTLRTPFEIPAAQFLGYHLSRLSGLNPDNPSPDGVINRVVQGVTIHSAEPSAH